MQRRLRSPPAGRIRVARGAAARARVHAHVHVRVRSSAAARGPAPISIFRSISLFRVLGWPTL